MNYLFQTKKKNFRLSRDYTHYFFYFSIMTFFQFRYCQPQNISKKNVNYDC